jgi:hypothetical protein
LLPRRPGLMADENRCHILFLEAAPPGGQQIAVLI